MMERGIASAEKTSMVPSVTDATMASMDSQIANVGQMVNHQWYYCCWRNNATVSYHYIFAL